MRREMGILIFLLLIATPFISSVDFQMNSNFSQGETLIAKISGNFIKKPIQQNIFLYRNKVRAPLDYTLVQVGDDFYLYAQLLGKEPENYSVVIKNAKYYTSLRQISDEDIIKNFTINEGTASFSIDPGFIETTGNFLITLTNLLDREITISVEPGKKENVSAPEQENSSSNSTGGFWDSLFQSFSSTSESNDAIQTENSNTQNFILAPTEKHTVEISLNSSTKEKMQFVMLYSDETAYSLPVHLLASESESNNNSHVPIPFSFKSDLLNISVASSDSEQVFTVLADSEDQNFTEITFALDNELGSLISVSPESISNVGPNEIIKINLTTIPESYSDFLGEAFSRSSEGHLLAQIGNETLDEMVLSINVFKGHAPGNALPKCLEFDGNVCSANSTCDGKVQESQEGDCCIGTCVQKETPKISFKLLGWILIILVLIFLVWFFKFRYKSVKNDPNLNKYLNKR